MIVKVDEGIYRVDVYIDVWDQLLNTYKNVSTKTVGGKDPSIAGYFRANMWRAGVNIPLFDETIKTLESV